MPERPRAGTILPDNGAVARRASQWLPPALWGALLCLTEAACQREDAPVASGQKPANPAMFTDATDGANWPSYGRTFDESHYSPLSEVDAKSIGRLGLQWAMDLPPGTTVGAPLAIDGVLYLSTGLSIVRAVDAATGRELWSYDPGVGEVAGPKLRTAWGARGIAWWNGKIYVGTLDGRLIAIDAKTGRPIWTAQTTKPGDGLSITGAPRLFNGKVIIGNGGADWGSVRGYVTTYDAETGAQLWRFYTVPGAGPNDDPAMKMAAKTWSAESLKHGGGGTVWNAITYDPEFNRIYLGTGNGSPWNPEVRDPGGGDDLFLSSIVALDADTGKYVWHYQVNPREAWDYTATMDIQLATLSIAGRARKVLLQAPKNGFFYVIDRTNGKLISAKPFVKVTWASGIDVKTGRPIEAPDARPGKGTATIWPGGAGGHNWQPMSYSPRTGLVYIPTTELPGSYDARGISPETYRRQAGIVLQTGYNLPDFSVPIPPPSARMGSLAAWDPVKQKRVWNIPQRSPKNGGVLSTGGDIVFQGQMDGWFFARDARTGKQLWSFFAQDGIIGQPITYRVNGHQHITVITGVSNSAGLLGGISAQFGWTYRGQKQRVLTFALDGKARLPAWSPTGPEQPLAAPDFKVDPQMASAGLSIYNTHCFGCHGGGAVAAGSAPDLRASPALPQWSTFYAIVHDGALQRQGMPRFDDLDADQLRALQHYVRQKADAARASDGAPARQSTATAPPTY